MEKTKNVLTDGEYSGERGKSDWPVTLPPRLLKDGFAIQPTKVTNMNGDDDDLGEVS